MEEIKEKEIFLISYVLSDKFNLQQWKIISDQSPENFLKHQSIILNKLLTQQYLFSKYFKNFYSNHVRLLNWSSQNLQHSHTVRSYVFIDLVNKNYQYYYQKIKKSLDAKRDKNKRSRRQQGRQKQIKPLSQEVYNKLFDNLFGSNELYSPQKISSSQIKLSHKKNNLQNLDGHDFYIKTFNACNGWKYIFYNYQKHMKGLNQKSKYNQKIRYCQNKSWMQNKNRNSLGLLDYQHPQLNLFQGKSYNLNKIVRDKKLNCLKGFKNLIKKSESGKLTFQNHLGKPVAYRICKN